MLPLGFLIYTLLVFGDVSCKRKRHSKRGDSKIVGGTEVSIDDFPYQAHLYVETNNGTFGCGGSIISNTYILTAGHCLTGAKKMYIRIGSDYADVEGVTLTSENFRRHPNYNPRTYDHDVAIVRPSSRITYGDKIKPIRLPAIGTAIPSGTEITVSGWGTTSENGDSSDVLMAVTIPTLSNEECRKSYRNLTYNMVCAGVPEGGKDSCQGDSGGPAVANNVQIGVVSFGIGCARPNYPGVYARLASPTIRKWIKINTGV